MIEHVIREECTRKATGYTAIYLRKEKKKKLSLVIPQLHTAKRN